MAAAGDIWLIGAGNMGGALRARWEAAGLVIAVSDPRLGLSLPDREPPAIVVLAVKPQVWTEATATLGGRLGAGTIIVSVMAGVRVATLAARFPNAIVARAMPNLPAAIGLGMTGLFVGQDDRAARPAVERLFALVGDVAWLEEEAEFDALTAVSGSGPAYLFAFIEALAAAGSAMGLGPSLAIQLARSTVVGAAAMIAGGASPAELRASVTSPGGTTAAGLAALLPGLTPLMEKTIAAAAARSRDLAASA